MPYTVEPKSLQTLALRHIQNNLSKETASPTTYKNNDEIDVLITNVKNGIFDQIMVDKEKYIADVSNTVKNILKNKPINKRIGSSYFGHIKFSADGTVGLQLETVSNWLNPETYKYHLHQAKQSLVVPFREHIYQLCHNQYYVIWLKFINVQYASLMIYSIANGQLTESPVRGVHVQSRFAFNKVALNMGSLAIHPTKPLAFRHCKDILEIHDLENKLIIDAFFLNKEIQKVKPHYNPVKIEYIHVGPDRIFIKCRDAASRGSDIVLDLPTKQITLLKKLIIEGKKFWLQRISPNCKSALWRYRKEIIITDTLTNEIKNILDLSLSKKLLHPYHFINNDMIIFDSSPFQVCWNFQKNTLQEVTCSSFVRKTLFNNNYIIRPYENYITVNKLSDIKKDELIKQLEIIKVKRNQLSLLPKPCLIDFKIPSSKYEFFNSLEKN